MLYSFLTVYFFHSFFLFFFFFNDTATTEIYTLSLHDALPTSEAPAVPGGPRPWPRCSTPSRSEEHTSELQSHVNLVCRLLLEKKKNKKHIYTTPRTHTQRRGAVRVSSIV